MTARLDETAAEFEPHRRRLTGLAYRMLGSLSEAEDIVQDAWLRWHRLGADGPSSDKEGLLLDVGPENLRAARQSMAGG